MRRLTISVGAALGALWAFAVVALPQQVSPQPFIPLNVAMIAALVPPGLVVALLVGVSAARRFFSVDLLDGSPPVAGSRADIDRRVLTNTVEQVVIAAALWPAVALVLGGLSVIVLGFSFAVARLIFWLGYHTYSPLRALGFAATFYPSVAAISWTGLVWVV